MGCGKTTLGSALARELGVDFVDLDDYIEQQCGCSVREIFATQGEGAFRQMERKALRTVATQCAGAVVACGGGTPCQSGNMALMNDLGITVWLTVTAERIAARLCLPEQKAKRPLIASLLDEEVAAYVRRNLATRTPHYAQAQLRFDATDIETAAATRLTAHRLATTLKRQAQKTK